MSNYQPLSEEALAQRIARDLPDGAYINLGIGLPTQVANYLPPNREIVLHSENGILGMGPAPAPDAVDLDLVNAGKLPVTLLPGGTFFHHADSFAIIRGGHLDIAVLGAYQVSATGDLANWTIGAKNAIPAVGGAMDLAVGTRQTWILMNLLTKHGHSKLVERCTYPITGLACVKKVYTDHAIFVHTPQGFQVIERIDGLTHAELERLTGLRLLA